MEWIACVEQIRRIAEGLHLTVTGAVSTVGVARVVTGIVAIGIVIAGVIAWLTAIICNIAGFSATVVVGVASIAIVIATTRPVVAGAHIIGVHGQPPAASPALPVISAWIAEVHARWN